MVVADTHILAWYLEGNARLPEWAVALLDESIPEKALLVSAMTVYEMGVLLQKGRVVIEGTLQGLFDHLLHAGVVVAPVDRRISLVADGFEMIHSDPLDRLIMATAVVHDAPLLTADRKILKYSIQTLKV